MHVTFTKLPEAEAYQSTADKVQEPSLPSSAHVHIGGGRHVVVDPKKPGPGWTMHLDEVRKHPSKEEWCHVAVAVPSAAVVADKELSLAEAELLTTKEAEAVELDATWDDEPVEPEPEPKPVEDVKTVTR